MMKHVLISSFLIFFLLHSTTTSGQSPSQSPSSQTPAVVNTAAPQAQAAQAPAAKPAVVQAPALTPPALPAPVQAPAAEPTVKSPPRKAPKPTPAPPNVTDILDKAGGFSVFSRLLHNTNVINQIENQLNSSNSLTILAPSNGGFSSLKAGTLNSLTPEQKVQLVQFHIIPNLVSHQNFETLTNPVRTQASNTKDYPLNITTEGSFVNISTGVVNTTLSGTVYADSRLAIYRVDSVLLPIGIFAPRVDSPTPSPAPEPALAPAPVVPLAKPKKEASSAAAAAASNSSAPAPANLKPKLNATALIAPVAALEASGGVSANGMVSVGFAVTVILLGQFV